MSALENFHLLRPLWLLGLPVCWLLIVYGWRHWRVRQDLSQWINPSLLAHLIDNDSQRMSRRNLVAAMLVSTIAVISLSGPTWEKMPQPVEKSEQAMVILLDLSPSMMAEDLMPSRLVRARYKITDLLNQRQDGLTALIAYAGEAYTVTPLSDDTRTITALLPSLSPNALPIRGSNIEMAYDMAIQVLKNGGHSNGDIVLFTDGIAVNASHYLIESANTQFPLSIIGLGTEEGAPIPVSSGGFAKERDGSIVLAKLQPNVLADIARRSRGVYRTLSHNNDDINAVLNVQKPANDQTREVDREFDQWIDRGGLLVLLLIPFVAMAFRRGVILPVLLAGIVTSFPQPSQAFEWKDLWQTRDQQAMMSLQNGDAAAAASKFEDPNWKGTAAYQAGDYQTAIDNFKKLDNPLAHYNRGNALAKSGQLEEAINAYAEALKQQPDFEDATANKELVEQLLKEQQEQQQKQQQSQENNQQQDSDDQSSDSQSSNNQSQNNNSQEQNSDSKNNQSQSDSSNTSNPDQRAPQDDSKLADNQEKSGKKSDEELESEKKAAEQADDSPEKAEQLASEELSSEDLSTDQQPADQQSLASAEEARKDAEQQQALEQWLRRVDDDPSGLMREKFNYEYQKRREQYRRGDWQPPENGALQRW